MTVATGLELANEVADAHASSTLASANHLNVSFSSGGLAFRMKSQPNALTAVRAQMTPLHQCISLTGNTPRPWTVQVANSGELRPRFDRLRTRSRRLRWQPEDLGAFAAAAIWTYLTLPLLLRHAEHVRRLPDAAGARRLRLTLPSTTIGHSRVQTLHIGRDSLIHRHDYTATVFGTWARVCAADRSVPNLRRRTRRHNPRRHATVLAPAAWPDARLDPDPLGRGGEVPTGEREKNHPLTPWRTHWNHRRPRAQFSLGAADTVPGDVDTTKPSDSTMAPFPLRGSRSSARSR